MSIEIASISFIESEVAEMHRIDMYSVLFANGMWLVLEGFLNGYVFTETGVDRLHLNIHDMIQPESAAIDLHTLVQTELATLFN